jgi:UDP-N-acetylmuramyl pentapeptide phosphotransferase/UDP-N-acetylglucosamine-1-phosphate transferase
MLIWLLIFILILSFAGTFLTIKVAFKKNILDVPNVRSSHSVPTPRGGGLAIILSWYIGLIGLNFLDLIDSNLFYALISGALLAMVGFLDDLYSIKPWIRILFQLVTVALGIYFLKGFKALYINDFVITSTVILTFIAVVGAIWFINLYNFLDGIDGYASVEAISIAVGMFIITKNPIFLILILSVLGFLIWNWPIAKIFMGDIGSTQLGYIFVILSLNFNNNHEFNIFGWLILSSLFWVDASLTLLRRWRNNEKLSQAHKKHAYQRIVQSGFSHRKTILLSILVNIVFITFVVLSEKDLLSYYVTFPLCIIINYLLIKLIDKRLSFSKDVPAQLL